MAVTPELIDKVRRHIGDTSPPVTATVDALTAQRYARAIGDDDPIYFDAEAARQRGYEDVIVPPNFLPSYLDWTDGGDEADLRLDGTPKDEMAWIPLQGVRLMGGGEEMLFHKPLTVGTEVTLLSTLDDVTSHDSRSGLMMVLRIKNTYTAADGEPVLTSIRTVLGR